MRRWIARAVVTCGIAVAVSLSAAASASAAIGSLSPATGTGACFLADPVAAGFPDCAMLPQVRSPQTVLVSPDGKHVYVAGRDNLAGILVFSRDPATGLLTQLAAPDGCLSGSGDGVTCTDVNQLGRPWSLTISPSGDRMFAPRRRTPMR